MDPNHFLVPIKKLNEEQRLAFGWANWSTDASGKLITDSHGDQIGPEILEKAAYRFVLRYREGGLEHERMGVASLVESVFVTREKVMAMGFDPGTFAGAGWWVGFRVDDSDVWAKVKSGELPDFSIGGIAQVIEE